MNSWLKIDERSESAKLRMKRCIIVRAILDIPSVLSSI
jgi:hypothetical protein